jgi:hypothetical protein
MDACTKGRHKYAVVRLIHALKADTHAIVMHALKSNAHMIVGHCCLPR